MKRADITDRMVCEACFDVMAFGDGQMTADELISRAHGVPLKVAHAAMQRAADRGLLWVGVSLRCAVLSPKGEDLLLQPESPPNEL